MRLDRADQLLQRREHLQVQPLQAQHRALDPLQLRRRLFPASSTPTGAMTGMNPLFRRRRRYDVLTLLMLPTKPKS